MLEVGTKLGRYEIRSQIGAGGVGEVYLAEDSQLHRKVALKGLPPEVAANDDRMRRFKQEAHAAAALNHPNIAHVYEIGESDGGHFIAMEFVDGIDKRGGLSNLWQQPIEGGTPKQLTDFKSGNIFSFDYSRDGKQLVLSRGTINDDVVLYKDFK